MTCAPRITQFFKKKLCHNFQISRNEDHVFLFLAATELSAKKVHIKFWSGKRAKFNPTKYIKETFATDVAPWGRIDLKKEHISAWPCPSTFNENLGRSKTQKTKYSGTSS